MNRAVKRHWHSLTKRSFGFFVMYGREKHPEVASKIFEVKPLNFGLPHPIPLVKYVLRNIPIYWLSDPEEKISLQDLKEIVDPLEPVTFWKFCGEFTYNTDKEAQGGPMGQTMQGSSLMKKIYKNLEEKHIHIAWEKARKYLLSPDGCKARLYYNETLI